VTIGLDWRGPCKYHKDAEVWQSMATYDEVWRKTPKDAVFEM